MGLLLSSQLTEGLVYTRAELADMIGSKDATINTGVFQPKNYDSILLFVTEKKAADKTQYVDRLEVNTLHWQGQTAGHKDTLIITHEANRREILIFYRHVKNEHPGSGFRYEGRFRYRSHSAGQPTDFILERICDH